MKGRPIFGVDIPQSVRDRWGECSLCGYSFAVVIAAYGRQHTTGVRYWCPQCGKVWVEEEG